MKKIVFSCCVLLLLNACDSVKESLGMSHYQADEFNVKQHEALEIPPNYNLMPPRKKEKDKDGNSIPIKETAVKAKEAIGGDGESELSKESAEEIKQKAGSADDSIRKEVDKEAEENSEETAVDKKLSQWKKEFLENAASINSKEKDSESKTDK